MPKEKTKKAKDLLNPPGPEEKATEDLEEIWRELIQKRHPIEEEREYQEKWKMWKNPVRYDDNREMWQDSDEKDDQII